MAVIQNIFKELEYKLNMQDEIKLFKWSQKPIKEKIAQLVEWKEEYSDNHILVKAAEEILKLNYPTEYLKYTSMEKKFKHSFMIYEEREIEDVGSMIEWLNSVFDYFEGLQEGLLGGLVVSPAFDGTIINCEYEKGKLVRVLNKGDGEEAEMLINLMDMESIPQELTIKKDVSVRGIVTLKEKNKKAKNQTMTAAVNEILFNERSDVNKLVFIPYEWIQNKKWLNTTKMYQMLKDNGFITPTNYKAGQVVEALDKYQEFVNTDFEYEKIGCRIEIEKSDTINELFGIMSEQKLTEYLHKIIMLG
jgi:NAD-dependent DNA ligase